MERSVLATALSHTGPHSGGRVISLHSLSDTEKQSVRVSAVFVRLEFVVGMDIEDRVAIIEQDDRVRASVGHVGQHRAGPALWLPSLDDVPFLGWTEKHLLTRRRVDEGFPLVIGGFAHGRRVRIALGLLHQVLVVPTTLEDRHSVPREIVRLGEHHDRKRRQDCRQTDHLHGDSSFKRIPTIQALDETSDITEVHTL